jgi:hypothetical protein
LQEVFFMRHVTVSLALLLVSASVASSQPTSGAFGGYLYAHPYFEDIHVSMGDTLNGWLGGVDVSIADTLELSYARTVRTAMYFAKA